MQVMDQHFRSCLDWPLSGLGDYAAKGHAVHQEAVGVLLGGPSWHPQEEEVLQVAPFLLPREVVAGEQGGPSLLLH